MRLLCIIVISSIFVSCSNKTEQQEFKDLTLNLEITPEFKNGGFSISWDDTLGSKFSKSKRYLEIRPLELYCYIQNKNSDTLGYYKGLSSPRQWTYFQTKDNDSIIYLNFSIGINHFSTHLANQTEEYINNFNNKLSTRPNFKTIKLNINSALRKSKEVRLVKN